MSKSARSVLVIGDDMRIFLSVVRSLGRAGFDVHAAPFDWHAPALRSKYVHRVHPLPRYGDNPEEWLRQLLALTHGYHFELIVPTCDRAIHPLNEHREALAHTRLAIPSVESMPILFDKERTRALCEDLGVPTAKGARLGNEETSAQLASQYGLPLILKPRQSYWMDQLDTWGKVWVVDTVEQLQDLLVSVPDRTRYLIESCFDGEGVGVSVLAERGEVLQAFQHRRLHEGRGGSSSYRRSEAVDPSLLDAVRKIASRVHLTGVCMFEFRHNPTTDRWILIETNARFWGSMSLPLSLGVDFPRYLFDLLVDGLRPMPVRYAPGIRSRNLVLDGHNLLQRLAHLRQRTVRETAADTLDFVTQPIRWVTGMERSDSFVRDDPMPGVAELVVLVGNAVRRALRLADADRLRRKADQRSALAGGRMTERSP